MARIDQARWRATANVVRFRELLDSVLNEMQDRRLEILLTPAPSTKSTL